MLQRSRIQSARQEISSARDIYKQTEEHHKFLERKKKEEKEKKKEQLDYRKAFLKNLAMPVKKNTTAMTMSSKTLSVNATAPKKRTFPSISSMSLNTKKAPLNSKNITPYKKSTPAVQTPAVKASKPEPVKNLAGSAHKDDTLPSINPSSHKKDESRSEKKLEEEKEPVKVVE